MIYFVLIPDGAADYPIDCLGGKTPLEASYKPTVDMLAKQATVGTVSNVPQGMVPESDTANLAILSYDPSVYSNGRSPLEAVAMGLEMDSDDVAFRCNVITVSDDADFKHKRIIDHSADEISTPEATELIKTLDKELGNDLRRFRPGVSYRHCMLWKNPPEYVSFERPHDHIGDCIGDILPGKEYARLTELSYNILNNHPVNESRIKRGLLPANLIWLWSPGKKPALPSFKEKWSLNGAVISAVDLIKGIGLCAGMKPIDVPGATGNWRTNFKGKADAAISAFRDGYDFVYVHVEAPDECGHRAELENKIRCISDISEKILKPVLEYLRGCGEDFSIMMLPDHPTPIIKRTHTIDPVPYFIYRSSSVEEGVSSWNEKTAAAVNNYLPRGHELMSHFVLKGKK